MLDVAVDAASLPGELLANKYRIERVLGQGGMGVVLGARNVLLGKRVAVKLVTHGAGGAGTVRLLMEARAAARLESDHAVRIFDVGHTEQGDPYLVMEHLEGRSLAQVLREPEPVGVEPAVLWVLQACEALAEAHAHGIVHRDVKPANLFLEERPDGSRRIKVLDFGIAKLPAGERLATTTHPIGSPIYMAPEQLANDADVDRRADVWGVGCVLYELLARRAPFEAGSVLELAAKVAGGSYRSLRSERPELSAALSAVVDRCLAADRTRRFCDLAELARALSPFAPAAARPLLERIERMLARCPVIAAANASVPEAAGEATRDLPSDGLAHAATSWASDGRGGADLRESTPALESSLGASRVVSARGGAHGGSRALLATVAAVSVMTLVFSLQRSLRPARAPAQSSALPAQGAPPPATPELAAHTTPEPAAQAAPEPRRTEGASAVARADASESGPARPGATKPRARRAAPKPARPKTITSTGGSEVPSTASERALPLPLDRAPLW